MGNRDGDGVGRLVGEVVGVKVDGDGVGRLVGEVVGVKVGAMVQACPSTLVQ